MSNHEAVIRNRKIFNVILIVAALANVGIIVAWFAWGLKIGAHWSSLTPLQCLFAILACLAGVAANLSGIRCERATQKLDASRAELESEIRRLRSAGAFG
jgi:hypothetical protein